MHDKHSTHNKLKQIAKETETDPLLSKLADIARNGWPNERNQVDQDCKMFWDYGDELTIEEGIIFKDYRAVIQRA